MIITSWRMGGWVWWFVLRFSSIWNELWITDISMTFNTMTFKGLSWKQQPDILSFTDRGEASQSAFRVYLLICWVCKHARCVTPRRVHDLLVFVTPLTLKIAYCQDTIITVRIFLLSECGHAHTSLCLLPSSSTVYI